VASYRQSHRSRPRHKGVSMNRLEIFQQVYGTDYVFTVKELERLRQVTEFIVSECADIAKHHVSNISTYADAEFVDGQIREHFGVEK
jgi:hypothetical protein